jgi:uncharacterized protein YcbX
MTSINDIEDGLRRKEKSYKADSRRFRANIYISGPKAYVEHDMLRMAVQGTNDSQTAESASKPIIFSMPSRTPRCTLPNVDPADGKKSRINEPAKYLKSQLVIDKGTDSPILGMHAVPVGDAVGKTVSVGDEIMFFKPGEHLYNKDPSKEAWTEVW